MTGGPPRGAADPRVRALRPLPRRPGDWHWALTPPHAAAGRPCNVSRRGRRGRRASCGRAPPGRADRDREPSSRMWASESRRRAVRAKKKNAAPPLRLVRTLAAGELAWPFPPHAPFAAARRCPALLYFGRLARRSAAAFFLPFPSSPPPLSALRRMPHPPPAPRRGDSCNSTAPCRPCACAAHSSQRMVVHFDRTPIYPARLKRPWRACHDCQLPTTIRAQCRGHYPP